jgi:hypothetical protein
MFQPVDVDYLRRKAGIDVQKELAVNVGEIKFVVSLRDIIEAQAIHMMSVSYLHRLLKGVTLVGDETERPYANCEIEIGELNPATFGIGQTFVQRDKYQSMIEGCFDTVFRQFAMGGISRFLPMVVTGRTVVGELAIAHYIPPIVEVNGDGRNLHLLDGIHRNFIIKGAGTIVKAILVRGVKIPFPCRTTDWNNIKVVNEKPPKSERFLDLRPELFRDLKAIGIDG